MLEKHAGRLLGILLLVLVALNAWRLDQWDADGLRVYSTHPIMQTTLFDFACVLAVLLVFIHRDARAHGLTYWWILPTFPFMPIIGILLYFMVRKQRLSRRTESDQPR
jgi:cytochrome bd-type quinol oxidase subunit 2